MLAKIGPGLNSNWRSSWLYALTPVMSLGSKSGVNWTRRTEQSIDLASALASCVFPTPGTSSIRTCPSASSTVSASRTAPGLPVMTVCTAALTCVATCTSSSSVGSASRPVSVTKVPSWRHSLIRGCDQTVRRPRARRRCRFPAAPPLFPHAGLCPRATGGSSTGQMGARTAGSPLHSTSADLETSASRGCFCGFQSLTVEDSGVQWCSVG